ncbi:unnamed protein product [Cylicostephanus goldi]|uniref:Ig-like domain-containing protein n=1 Tax=Cylicostephanus goldi TaxID=71465 RepID=A0A3P6QXA9_CYLGO|nr:unnamed protein product [Cylicostephanus goldi]
MLEVIWRIIPKNATCAQSVKQLWERSTFLIFFYFKDCTYARFNICSDGEVKSLVPEAPWVKTEFPFVPVKKNTNKNISCSYDGTPSPQAEWFFNGYKINFSEERFRNTAQYAQRSANHTNAILSIVGINEDLFGDYMCRISNNLGSAFAVIHVSGRPGPPTVTADGSDLTWSVRAYEPVIEYRIYYRPENADEWNKYESIRAAKGDNNGDDIWQHSVSLLPYLQAGVRYEVTVKARNALGWGSFARENLLIEIPADTVEVRNDVEWLEI